MQKFHVSATQETPMIDLEEGKIMLKGTFYPENVISFFQPAMNWLEEYYRSDYFQNKNNPTNLHIFLPYLNTASSKIIFDVLIALESFHTKGHNIKIYHYYDENTQDSFFDIVNDGDFEISVEHVKRV